MLPVAHSDIARNLRFLDEEPILPPQNPAWADRRAHLCDLIALQQVFSQAFANTMTAEGLRASLLPITTHSVSSPMAVGSDSTPIQVELNGVRTYLSDSMQFLLEYACRFTPKGSYYMMPSFRGEMADSRHLSQFYHAEAEIPGGLDEVISLVETLVRNLSRAFIGGPHADLVRNPTEVEALATGCTPLPRISVDEAAARLAQQRDCVVRRPEGQYVTNAGERALLADMGGPFWLVRHYAELVPFYQKACPHAPHLSETADLIMGIGETAGAGARHPSGADVRRALAAQQVPMSDYGWYVGMKDETPMQTAGFGMGVERFLMWITAEQDIRHFEICPRRNGKVCVP